MMLRFRCSFTLAITLGLVAPSFAADWARWLGPDQNGRSPEEHVFDAETPQLSVAWTRELGIGYSAIAVAGGKAITLYSDGTTDWLVAFSTADGKRVWRHAVHPSLPKVGASDGGPLSMPVVDDGIVYAFGPAGHLVAVKLTDGSEVWSRDLAKAMNAPRPFFGFTTTPLVVKEKLFLQLGADTGRSMVALDKLTGKTLWQVGDEPVGYQSPIVTAIGGDDQIVAVTDVAAQGLRPQDGKRLWHYEHGIGEGVGWASAVRIGGDAFVLVGRKESVAFEVTRTEAGWQVGELWRGSTLKRNFANPVLHDGHLFGYDGGALACIDARTGKQVWKQPIEAVGLVLVDGHLVLLDAEGRVSVVEATSRAYVPKASTAVTRRGSQTSPSFSDGSIYVRNLDSIARIDVKRP